MAHLCVELVVAEVQRRVNWFERLEIYVHFLFFPILCQDGASIHHQAILWHLQVSSGCCTWQQNTHTHKRRSKNDVRSMYTGVCEHDASCISCSMCTDAGSNQLGRQLLALEPSSADVRKLETERYEPCCRASVFVGQK